MVVAEVLMVSTEVIGTVFVMSDRARAEVGGGAGDGSGCAGWGRCNSAAQVHGSRESAGRSHRNEGAVARALDNCDVAAVRSVSAAAVPVTSAVTAAVWMNSPVAASVPVTTTE